MLLFAFLSYQLFIMTPFPFPGSDFPYIFLRSCILFLSLLLHSVVLFVIIWFSFIHRILTYIQTVTCSFFSLGVVDEETFWKVLILPVEGKVNVFFCVRQPFNGCCSEGSRAMNGGVGRCNNRLKNNDPDHQRGCSRWDGDGADRIVVACFFQLSSDAKREFRIVK